MEENINDKEENKKTETKENPNNVNRSDEQLTRKSKIYIKYFIFGLICLVVCFVAINNSDTFTKELDSFSPKDGEKESIFNAVIFIFSKFALLSLFTIFSSYSAISTIFTPSFIRFNYILLEISSLRKIVSIKANKTSDTDKSKNFEEDDLDLHIFSLKGRSYFQILAQQTSLVFGIVTILIELARLTAPLLSKLKPTSEFDLTLIISMLVVLFIITKLLATMFSGSLLSKDEKSIYLHFEKRHKEEFGGDFPSIASKITLYRIYIVIISFMIVWCSKEYLSDGEFILAEHAMEKTFFLLFISLLFGMFYSLHRIHRNRILKEISANHPK